MQNKKKPVRNDSLVVNEDAFEAGDPQNKQQDVNLFSVVESEEKVEGDVTEEASLIKIQSPDDHFISKSQLGKPGTQALHVTAPGLGDLQPDVLVTDDDGFTSRRQQDSKGAPSPQPQKVEIAKSTPATNEAGGLKSKKSLFKVDKSAVITKGKSKNYTSRRTLTFDNQDSGDEENVGFKDTGAIKYKDTNGLEMVIQPNMRLAKYKHVFQNLLKTNSIITQYPVMTMLISYDSKRAISVQVKDDNESYIVQHSIQTQELKFKMKFGGSEDNYIKLKEVQQNSNGSMFAAVYSDDGKFFLRVFTQEQQKHEKVLADEVNFNELFGIDDYTMTIDQFPDPYITCCFVNDDKVFVNFFHNYTLKHYHFYWDIEKRVVVGPDGSDQPYIYEFKETNRRNFPQKCFYSVNNNEIYALYRQGQIFTINPEKLDDYRLERITELDLGQMELLFDAAICVRSSSKVLFFKQVYDQVEMITKWVLYETIKVRGFVYFIRGNVRIQITTEKLIYFYLIDPDTLEPKLENVMYNYMCCNQMMIGAMRRYSITYKQNERSFDIYQRKYMHNLRVCVDANNYEGAKSLEIASSNLILVSKIDKVITYDNETYQEVGSIPITLLKTETREPNEVIGMRKSRDEDWLAIVSGKNLIMDEQKQNQLFVFKRVKAESLSEYDEFVLHQRIVVKDMPIFKQVSMQFHFKYVAGQKETNTIIFCKPDEIFELNFDTKEVTTVMKLKEPLDTQPIYFQCNDDQNRFIISNDQDAIYLNLEDQSQLDLDQLFQVFQIKAIIYDPEDMDFYFLANERNGAMGFFLIKFKWNDPSNFQFITMWRHNLNIGDANVFISRGTNSSGQPFKELVLGCKTISINCYSTMVIDLSQKDVTKGRQTLQKHEAFQLWESQVSGLLLEYTKDYLTFSKAGINILALGTVSQKPLKDSLGFDKIVHSLDSLSHLKVDQFNYINFRCQDYENRVVSIEQEWQETLPDGSIATYYDEIYKIKIFEVTLRELLIFQSFYVSKTSSDIINLIRMQPDPRFFYKTFLELGACNFCSILSFDSQSMNYLLSDQFDEYFSEEYPIIFKNKFLKKDGKGYYYTNAIDNALKNNQVMAVNLLLSYIVKYQNNFVSSYLFLKNLPVLMEKGISLHDLLDASIFDVVFDYDNWPGNHPNDEDQIRAYNGSFFDIRHAYNEIFHDIPFEEPQEAEVDENGKPVKSVDNQKIFKIKYSINLLAQIDFHVENTEAGEVQFMNEEVSLMNMCGETEELEIFETQSLQQVIQFKWDTYGRKHHVLGCIMHFFYTLILIIYVKNAYLVENEDQKIYAILIAVGVLYPGLYDFTQMIRAGVGNYFSDLWNYADMLYIYGSIFNIVLQLWRGPFDIYSRSMMCIIVLLLITKTFFFLRIFPLLTPIVVMINNVVYDLRIFLFFYLILISLFCQIFAILGLGNEYLPDKPRGYINPNGPAVEYQAVGLHFGQFFWTFRLSLGDFSAIGASAILKKIEMQIFWVMWIMTVVVTCIIFLNFVVAEACASYSRVVESLESVIKQAQASLIGESEDMTLNRFKNRDKFPKFLITRTIEE